MLRRLPVSVVCALAGGALLTAAGLASQPQSQQPIFRSEIDVIRLDVSVLDDDRRPVRGLTAADFSVFEDGKRQEVVAVVEVDAADNDPVPSAWMRFIPRDVA